MGSTFFIIEGSFKEDLSQKTIQLSNKKSPGSNEFDMTDKIKYEIRNDLLYLSIDDDDEGFEFVLEKKARE